MDRRSPHAYGRSVTKFHVKELETGTMHRGFEHGRNATGPQKLTVLLAGVGLALVLGVTAVAAESTTPSFARARNYAAGHVALSMTASDLNGDGRPDLAAASPDANAVSVLTRRSDGSFEAVQNYRTGRSPFSVASSDLNVDGALDLATANLSADTVSVLVNKGDGSFEPKRDYATGDEPWVVAVGDLNGDGKQDLATANHASRGTVSVLVNRGDGSFQPKRDYVTGSEPREVTIGDLNGDGKPDLATANHDASSVSVLMNNGDGTFRMRRDLATGYGPVSVAIGDVNGDGTADLVVTSVVIAHADTVTVSVFSNRGDGSFRSRINYRAGRYPNSPEYYPDAVALGDLNGDGNPDLAIVNSEEDFVWVLANRGDGSFRPKLNYRTAHTPSAVEIHDLDSDGKLDLSTANGVTVSVLINTPGLCTVQDVRGMKLPTARRTLARANCAVGMIHRVYSRVEKGRVSSQNPKFGAVLRRGGRVNLGVSRGRKR
jgi:hypothetical protein